MKKTPRRKRNVVEVELMTPVNDMIEVGVIFRSGDRRTPLTAQQMVDALADALILDSDVSTDMEPQDEYDA